MENYHLFVVDKSSLKFHLEYGFVGTGSKGDNFYIGLWKDIERLKIGDKVIFYVQSLKKFFGIFEVSSEPFFDESEPLYLQEANPTVKTKDETYRVKLKYRALIVPSRVYQNGVDEFDLIDILPPNTEDVLWSILYRKLKGKRGNSPLFPGEFNIIEDKLRTVNDGTVLNFENYTFENNQIVESNNGHPFQGNIDRNVDLKNQIINNDFTEHHLHAFLLETLPNQIFGQDILWIGNEVYSGAGMQAIDLMSIYQQNNENVYQIIEVKKGIIPNDIPNQVKKYAQWIKGRFNIQTPQNLIRPIIVGKKATKRQRKNRSKQIIQFNNINISLPIKYFEYEVIAEENLIRFCEINLQNQNETNIFNL